MFFKLSVDMKFTPIKLDLVTYFGDFVPPIRQVLQFFEQGKRFWGEIRRTHAQRYMLPPNSKRTINFPHFYV